MHLIINLKYKLFIIKQSIRLLNKHIKMSSDHDFTFAIDYASTSSGSTYVSPTKVTTTSSPSLNIIP